MTLPKEELLMTKNQQFIQKLYELCKECKEQLSTNSEHVFNYYGLLLLLEDHYESVKQLIQSLEEKTSDKINKRKKNKESSFKFIVTRKQFEKWISPVLDRIEQTVLHTLQQYKQKKQEEKNGELVEETKDFVISIDEVVLVGGSSQIPLIQSTLRKACGKMGVHHFAVRNEFSSTIDEIDDDKEGEQSKGNDESPQTLVGKEFCVSINPNYAVVEGLAIRGAIIAGEDGTMLKDILMMDCLPMTLGLLLFSDSNDKYFEPIIYQGSKLPIEQRKRISIADPNQKFVTLEIYEEIEEILEADKMKYSYYLLVTCDALIEKLEDDLSPDESRIVEVVFRIEEDSHLSYKVVEVRENASSAANEVKSNNKKIDHSSQQMMLLVVYSCFLLLVYVGMKFLFSNTSQYTEE